MKVLCTLILGLMLALSPAQAQQPEKTLYPLLSGWVCSSKQLAVQLAWMHNDGMPESRAAGAINTKKTAGGRCDEFSFYAEAPIESFGEIAGTRYKLRFYEVVATVRRDGTMVRYRQPVVFYTCKFIHTDKG